MPACIYCIKNSVNDHCYIGQTINFIQRKSKHFRELEKNEHHNIPLQRAYNKYSKENFSIYIIENNVPLENLKEREDYWIDKMGYYNIDGGRKAFTPSALRNMSESHINKINPNRLLNKKEVFYILAIGEFCDGAQRAIASLTSYSREVAQNIIKRKTYREISKIYDNLCLDKKLIIFKKALEFFQYNPWKNTSCSCPKKNRYMLYIIQKTSHLKRQEVADMLQMSKSGLRLFCQKVREGRNEIDTTMDNNTVLKVLEIILDEQYRAKFSD